MTGPNNFIRLDNGGSGALRVVFRGDRRGKFSSIFRYFGASSPFRFKKNERKWRKDLKKKKDKNNGKYRNVNLF